MSNNKPSFTIEGFVTYVGKTQTFGKGFSKRELVIEDNPKAEYPDCAAFEFTKESTSSLDSLRRGDKVRVTFRPQARYWDPKDGKREGRWFSSLYGIKVVSLSEAQNGSTEETVSAADVDSEPGELPF